MLKKLLTPRRSLEIIALVLFLVGSLLMPKPLSLYILFSLAGWHIGTLTESLLREKEHTLKLSQEFNQRE